MDVGLSIDSGAFSIYTKHSFRKGHNGADSFEYYKTKKFREYTDTYIAWLKKNGANLDFCVTLDVIFNPDLSFGLWKELSQELKPHGLDVIPVVHNGEDPKWAVKYAKLTDYIGLGGMGKKVTFQMYATWVASVFKTLGSNELRFHGFAVSQPKAVELFKWYSVDSASPFWWSANGFIRLLGGQNNSRLFQFDCSRRTFSALHLAVQGETISEYIDKTLQRKFHLTTADLDGNHYVERALVNYMEVFSMIEALGVRYYVSGWCPGKKEDFTRFLTLLEGLRHKNFRYLGSYFNPKVGFSVVEQFKEEQSGNKQASKSAKPRATRPAKPRLHSGAHPFRFQPRKHSSV